MQCCRLGENRNACPRDGGCRLSARLRLPVPGVCQSRPNIEKQIAISRGPVMPSESTFVKFPYLTSVSSISTMTAKSGIPEANQRLLELVNQQLRHGISNGAALQGGVRDGDGKPIGVVAIVVGHGTYDSPTVTFSFYHYSEIKAWREIKDTGILPEEVLTVTGTDWKLERGDALIDSGKIPGYQQPRL